MRISNSGNGTRKVYMRCSACHSERSCLQTLRSLPRNLTSLFTSTLDLSFYRTMHSVYSMLVWWLLACDHLCSGETFWCEIIALLANITGFYPSRTISSFCEVQPATKSTSRTWPLAFLKCFLVLAAHFWRTQSFIIFLDCFQFSTNIDAPPEYQLWNPHQPFTTAKKRKSVTIQSRTRLCFRPLQNYSTIQWILQTRIEQEDSSQNWVCWLNIRHSYASLHLPRQ